jgi:hypothetical protein
MIINEIANEIAENIAGLTLGTNMFKGFMPEKPDDCVLLLDTGGAEPDRELPMGSPSFQILVRNKSYSAGDAIMKSIVDLLHQKMNETLGSTYFYTIFLMGEAGYLGRDAKGRDEWSVNFICQTRR